MKLIEPADFLFVCPVFLEQALDIFNEGFMRFLKARRFHLSTGLLKACKDLLIALQQGLMNLI